MSKDYIAALDIGTTKISAIVGRPVGDTVEIIGTGMALSAGVKKGIIVDLESTGAAVYEAITMAEESSGVEIRSVYVGVAGSHMECIDSYGATGIKGKTVTSRDIDNVMNSASTIYVPLDREVLHVLPKDYAIDGQEGIIKPHGMSGVRLEANVRVITAAQSALDNIVRCVGIAGASVVDMVFEAIASAKSVLGPEELEAGVAVVDIGGGTTDVAVFREGGLVHAAVIPVGGTQFTNDLAVGLRVPLKEAERLKTQHGYVTEALAVDEAVGVEFMDGSVAPVKVEAIRRVLEPRSEELMQMVSESVRPYLIGTSGSCVVLSGGAARLRGLDRVAEAAIGIPTRIGEPSNACSELDLQMLADPAHATGVGLMLYGHEQEELAGRFVLGYLRKKLKGLGGIFSAKRGRGYGARKHVLAGPGA